MLSDEPIDEDLEALLYAQVYYGKEQEVELPTLPESEPTALGGNGQDQAGATSEAIGSRTHFHQKKRYFENNLVQEDREKEKRDSLDKETTESIAKQYINSENSINSSTTESNISQEISEKYPPDQTIPLQKDQGLDNTANQQVIKISTSSPSTNPSSKDSSTQFVTTVTTPTEVGHPQLLNNITINQYLFPPSFEERLKSSLEDTPISKKCKSDLNRLKKGHISEQEFFNNLRRRLSARRRQQTKIRKAYLKKQQSIAQSEVINLSDSDSSDIEIVEVTSYSDDNEKESATMTEKVSVRLEESEDETPEDDEIIYVAPPPVPVISIDTESDTSDNEGTSEHNTASTQTPKKVQSSQTLSDSQLDVDETSDDFLQPKNTPDNFNFSLHGSDFQNSEFVRPANPTDIYETESSTSTSDFNRDSSRQFCNSVKTIVFNEVEFPNQDIFDENNLDSFGEFITPRRAEKEKNAEQVSSCVDNPSTSQGSKRVNLRASSESSSESEYEDPTSHQNLPDLSPMVCAESSPKKGKASKKNVSRPSKKKKGKLEEQRDYNTRSNKKKPKEKFPGLNDGIIDDTELAGAKEPTRRSKRSVAASEEQEEIPRKKSRKKKNKLGTRNDEEEYISEASNSTSDRSASPRKNTKDNNLVTSSTTSQKKTIEDESEASNILDQLVRKKNKKKKKQGNTDEVRADINEKEVLTVEEKDTTEDSTKKKGKKKKAKGSSSKSSEDRKIDGKQLAENKQGIDDSGKKKNKKRKHKESAESRVILEISSTTIDNNELTKITDSGGNSNVNKLSGDPDILTEEVSVPEKNDTSENNKKKNKKKKRVSTDKINSVEEFIATAGNGNANDKGGEEEERDKNEKEGKLLEKGISNENVVEVPQSPEEDVILIEKVIPVHTIESSESDEDILTLDDVGNDLALVNISVNLSGAKEQLVGVADNKEFDVDYVQSRMSDDPEKWKVLPTDRNNMNIAKKGPRCNKCRHFGHISISCPNKPTEPVCTLCGEHGHQEPRCPNKVCFTCGKPGNFSTIYCYMCVKQRTNKCSICFIVGHRPEYCPDLWRRYFLTTKEGRLTVPRKNCPTLKPRNKQWCSGCASNGHLEFECNTYKWIREYPASTPRIFQYSDVYADRKKDKPRRPPSPSKSVAVDRAHLDYQKFVASLSRPKPSDNQMTARRKNVTQSLAIVDKNSENNAPVTETVANQEISEKPTESLVDTTDKREEERHIVESQPTIQSATIVDQHIAETNSGRMVDQSAQSSPHNPSNQIQSSPQSGQRHRSKQKRNSPKYTKINPVSVLRPTGYTPYHSVLNPYSVLGVPAARPSQELVNQVPGDVLVNPVSNFHNFDEFDYYRSRHFQNQTNFYQEYQYGAPQYDSRTQTYPSPLPSPSNAYQDFLDFHPPEPYHNIHEPHGDRGFLDRPHTITRDPVEEREIDVRSPHYRLEDREPFIEDRERQVSLQRQLEYGFHGRRHEDRDGYIRDGRDPRATPIRPRTPGSRPRTPCADFVPSDVRSLMDLPVNDYVFSDIPSLMDVPVNVFRGERAEPQIETPNSNFYSLNTIAEDNPHIIFNKNSRFINVDDSTKKKFDTSSNLGLKHLIRSELSKLDSLRQADVKTYRKKLNTIDNLKKKIDVKTNSVKKQMYFLFKQINMFLFGVHHLVEGKRHLDYLRYFTYKFKGVAGDDMREELLQAYGYIFGGEHPDFNYRRYLTTLTVVNKK